ncbi:hypothetical protein DL769_002898 [Monosporascus sp. CRB-8-3]|nr:hypothetical protein DL769_002898 [Monosporascus sp. CRB-8-3]
MLANIRGKVLTIGVASVLTVILIYLALQESEYSPTKLASNLGYGPAGEQDTSKGTSWEGEDAFASSPTTTKPVSPPASTTKSASSHAPTTTLSDGWEFDWKRDERNLGLSQEQCKAAFPLQYAEIERARDWHASQGGIKEDQIKLWINEPDKAHGQIRMLIYDGDLYVVGEKQGVVDRARYLQGGSMIYRAITAIPDPSVLPNIEFTLDRMDHPNPEPRRPGRVAWAWTRQMTDNDTWVMPDFNGWASSFWDTVGGYRAFRERSKKYLTPFNEKTKKALWRGQINVGQKISEVRKRLIEVSKDKPWSDIEEIRWDSGLGHPVQMEEHCKWQFLVHTEGNSWSGRLRNLVNCNSAIIIHNPLNYTAHFYSVLTPDGPNQNYIPAKNDWSDLEDIMNYYLEHQDEAERIAEETRRTFRDRYMTPAAEACYIRQMIYEWAKVQKFDPKLYKQVKDDNGEVKEKQRGYSWERFVFRAPARFDIPPPPDDYFFKSNQIDFED